MQRRLVLLSIIAVLAILPAQAVAQKKPRQGTSPTPAPAQPAAASGALATLTIPLPEIAPRAEELTQQLRAMSDRLSQNTTLSSIEQQLASQQGLIDQKQRELNELIAATPTRTELRDVEKEWLAQKELQVTMRQKLTERATAVEEDVRQLDGWRTEWGGLLKQIHGSEAVQSSYDRIRNLLVEIDKTSAQASEQLRSLLALQDRVSNQNEKVLEALKSISRSIAQVQRSLLDPDSPPLWSTSLRNQSEEHLDHLVRLSFNRNVARTWEFIKARRYFFVGILLFFLIALAGIFSIRQRASAWIKEHPDTVVAMEPLQHPVPLALLVVLMVILPMMPGVPTQVRVLAIVLSLAPVSVLLLPLIRPAFHSLCYTLLLFGLTAWAWESVVTHSGWKRCGLAVLDAAVITIGVWLTRRARHQLQPLHGRFRLILIVTSLSLVLIPVFAYCKCSWLRRALACPQSRDISKCLFCSGSLHCLRSHSWFPPRACSSAPTHLSIHRRRSGRDYYHDGACA